MGSNIEFGIVERLFKSKFGTRIRQWLIIEDKIVAKRWKSIFVASLERQIVKQTVNLVLVEAAVLKAAAALRAKLLNRFEWLVKFDERTFAEIWLTVQNRGLHVDAVVRGLAIERFIPSMAEMEVLFQDLRKLLKATEKDWGPPMLLSGLRTPNRNQIADWVVCSIHKDGRIWIMALVESKSISNMGELIEKDGRGAGQFMWDYLRAKGEGLVIDVVDAQGNITPRTFAAKEVLLEPLIAGATKSPKYPTRLIGVVPEKFSTRTLLKAQQKRLEFEWWLWPVSQGEMLKFIEAIEKSFNR
jgi:hypothetical protein